MLKTFSTTAGDFKFRITDETTDDEIGAKLARKLGFRDAWVTNSSGSFRSFQVNLGTKHGSGMLVQRTVTVYR